MTKKALVTGASEGIGRAIAQELARAGYSLTLVARNESRLVGLLKELPGSGHRIFIADLTLPEDLHRVKEDLAHKHQHLLVNNAGEGVYGKFSEVSSDRLIHMLRLNIESLLVLSHAFLKNAKPGDALVNVSSTLAFLPLPGSATYSASKSFVTAFSEAIWFEEKKRDVYVMNLCPGLTRTEFSSRAGGRSDPPPDSMFQNPEDVAKVMMQSLKDRKEPTVISGSKNRTLAFITRFLSRKKLANMMGRVR